jgi:hypothetical protein
MGKEYEEPVKAIQKSKGADKILDGDFSINLSCFNSKGNYDITAFIRLIAGVMFLSLFLISFTYLAILDYYKNQMYLFHTMEDFKYFVENSFYWWYENSKVFIGVSESEMKTDYMVIGLISFSITTLFSIWLIKTQRFKGKVQSFLSSNNLSQYYLKSYDKKTRKIFFKLIKGQKSNYKGFIDNADNFKQMFQVGKLKASRNLQTEVILEFLKETPRLLVKYKGQIYSMEEQESMVADGIPKDDFTISSTCKRTNYTKELQTSNKSMLGVKDIDGKPLYASFPQTVGMIQGHFLVGGGTGSGKSFMTTNWIKNVVMGASSEFIDHIFTINLKEDSNDWNFLKDYKKASLYTGLEQALVALKKAELKMLANNRWNTLNDRDNTDFGQTIVIIDEIHKFQLIAQDKTQPKTVRTIAEKSITIIDILATQARSANVFIIAILQKATLDQLSGIFRSNALNRILLKSDKVSSHVVIDKEEQEERMIDSQKITSGQFIYYNMQNGLMTEGFAVESVKWNLEKANAMEENPVLIKGRKESNELIEKAKIVAVLKAKQAELDAEDSEFNKKVNDYSSLELNKRDYWQEAEEIYNKHNGDILKAIKEIENSVEETNESKTLSKPKVNVKVHKKRNLATTQEIEKFENQSKQNLEIEEEIQKNYKKIEKRAKEVISKIQEKDKDDLELD